MEIPKGYYQDRYGPLQGREWVRSLPPEERAAFSHVGYVASEYGRRGGRVRAETAKRDKRGRFAPGSME